MRLFTAKTAVAAIIVLLLTGVSIFAQETQPPDKVETPQENAAPVADEKPSQLRSLLASVPILFSGYFWVDTGYMERKNEQQNTPDETFFVQQGRFCLGATYFKEADWFYGLARVEYLGHVNESASYSEVIDTLDSYVQFGCRWLDLQVGRFLAWELYHKGQGLELYTLEDAGAKDGPDLYELDYTRGHGNEVGQFAIHGYPLDMLKIEFAGMYGNENQVNYYGFRPVADIRWWNLQLVAGFEYLHGKAENSESKLELVKTGYAGRLQYNSGILVCGFNFARADNDYTDTQGKHNTTQSFTITSYGGFADIDFWKNSIGIGCHYTFKDCERGDTSDHLQPFASYLYRLPVRGLSVKFVFAMAIANIKDLQLDDEWKNDMYTGRIRISYELQ